MAGAVDQRRRDRLLDRIGRAAAPVVWLRGMAGSGKSRILRAFAEAGGRNEGWRLFDVEPHDQDDPRELVSTLRQGLAEGGRALIASRPSPVVQRTLLRSAAYGQILLIGDDELFFRPDELEGLGDGGALHAATAGWPLLVGPALEGRADEIRAVLPDFLAEEALPSAPHALAVALFAASDGPLPAGAAGELFGGLERLHPFLRSGPAGLEIASAWLVEAVGAVKARPNLWRRATASAIVRIHARHGDPERAIAALNAMGQSRMACSVYDQAGGPLLAFHRRDGDWPTLMAGFAPGFNQRKESLVLGQVWADLARGLPAMALGRLESSFPGLPVDLRAMRYSHRPMAILFRLLVEADTAGPVPAECVRSWGQLDALLDQDDPVARTLLARTVAVALAAAGEPAAAARPLRAWAEAHPIPAAPVLGDLVRLTLAHLAVTLGELASAREALASVPDEALARMIADLAAYEDGAEPAAIDGPGAAGFAPLSWPALSFDHMRRIACAACWAEGLAAALERLEDLAAGFRRRHAGADERALQVLRIRLFQLARRHAEAEAQIEALGSGAAGQAGAGEEALVRLRALVAQRRFNRAAAAASLERANAAARLPRARLTLGVLAAQAHFRAGEAPECRRQVVGVINTAMAGGQLGPLVEDAEFLEGPLGLVLASPAAHPRTVVEFAQGLARRLSRAPVTASHARDAAGLSRQEHRVLDHLSDGKSNKEIARALEISESTVKFHLRALFARFEVDSRNALIDAARARGVIR